MVTLTVEALETLMRHLKAIEKVVEELLRSVKTEAR